MPCVIDADGLNLLGEYPEYMELLREGRFVLTPHMKEMSRLTGVGIKKIKEQRIPLLEEFVQEYGCTCILKDSCTIVSAEGEHTYVNQSGNEAMAKGGAGDVLQELLQDFWYKKCRRERQLFLVYMHMEHVEILQEMSWEATVFLPRSEGN